eukprot:CAMPEP_0175163716 /NCGR_PEP_ID=MMETSP0087-20121206/25939_1 /TAXON_ID=136419 /ORGANISM="Unknown Unknown, Strain D1" /LENGTH=127 /DNA_ID=CAMNT_0016452521 /DNA_START=23 /DNA_END=406 /DNA_ORIENTATION=-
MGKSIRSKIKRKFRAIKRANLADKISEDVNEKYIKLKLRHGKSEVEAEKDLAKDVKSAETDVQDNTPAEDTSDLFEFGKPAYLRKSKQKLVQRYVHSKKRNGNGVAAYTAFRNEKRKNKPKGSHFAT